MIRFAPREAMQVSVAARVACVTPQTVRRWCEAHGIGRKVGGRFLVSRPAFVMMIEGDQDALDLYRAGERADERVRHYFERMGVPN